MKSIKTILSLACIGILVSVLVLIACSPSGPGDEVQLYGTTKVISVEEAENIMGLTEDRDEILFKDVTAFVAGLELGDVLVCEEPVSEAEYGFLVRVMGVSDGGKVMRVEPATVEDAIEQGVIEVTQVIPQEDLMSSALWATGVQVIQAGAGYEFDYSPAEGVTIEGHLRVVADAEIDIKASFWRGLKEFQFTFSPGLQMGATVTVENTVSWDKKYTIAKIPGPVIPIWGPVSITPSIELVVGTDGEIYGVLETGMTYERVYDVGIRYYHGTWSTINEMRGTGATLTPPSFRGQTEAKVYGGAVLSGMVGVSYVAEATLRAELLGNIRASGEIETSPWRWQYDLELYLTAQVFANLNLLRIAKVSWASDTWQYPNPPYNLAYGASGRVTTRFGNSLADVEIDFSGGYPSVTTDADGYWTKHLLTGTVVATPRRPGYVFDSSSMTITGSASNCDFQALILQVAAHDTHTVGLKTDGTVVAVGNNEFEQCNVGGWGNITQVAAGGFHTVGLKTDGTVVAVGPSDGSWADNGQCDVGGWGNITQVAAGADHTVGLKSDGTVVAVGDNDDGQCDVGGWTDIVQVAACRGHTVGLRSDGTVVAVGYNTDGQCNVGGWTDMMQVATGGYHTVGLKSDGTVAAVGKNDFGQCNVGSWADITGVAASRDHTIGLRPDGSVVAVGANQCGQCNVAGWTDIIQVAAGESHTVGLKADGAVVTMGCNFHGQCDVGGWDLSP